MTNSTLVSPRYGPDGHLTVQEMVTQGVAATYSAAERAVTAADRMILTSYQPPRPSPIYLGGLPNPFEVGAMF